MLKINDLNYLNSQSSDVVSTKHIDYIKHLEQVKLVNDIYNGVDTSLEYLFKFPQEIDDTFELRKDRATLRNFVKRAVQAFTGMIFRKPLEISGYGDKTEKLFEKIDTKQNIENFTKDVATALTKDGKAYILADSPISGEEGEPFLVLINRTSLINWRKDENGKFTMVVIEEVLSEPYGMFGTTYFTQWRVYDEFGDITIWRNNSDNVISKSGGYYIYDEIETGFDSIPIQELYIEDVPVLYDIAKLNIKHFNRMSHKDRYLTMAALPIPVIWGGDVDDGGNVNTAKPAMVLGVDEAMIFTSKEDSDFQWRELSGNSINLIEDDLNSIVEDITTGILRAAESNTAVQKTATEVQLLQAEASNRVTQIANTVEIGMQKALEILSYINNEDVPETATFIVNKDFNSSLMGSDGARLITENYMQGLLSMETFLNTLGDMELINIESAEKEMIRIANDNFKPTPKIKPINQDKRTVGASSLT